MTKNLTKKIAAILTLCIMAIMLFRPITSHAHYLLGSVDYDFSWNDYTNAGTKWLSGAGIDDLTENEKKAFDTMSNDDDLYTYYEMNYNSMRPDTAFRTKITVLDSKTNEPIKDAHFIASIDYGSGPDRLSIGWVKTDENGQIELRTSQAYFTFVIRQASTDEEKIMDNGVYSITMSEDTPEQYTLFNDEALVFKTYTATITLLDGNDKSTPIPNVVVNTGLKDLDEYTTQETTDENGQFTLSITTSEDSVSYHYLQDTTADGYVKDTAEHIVVLSETSSGDLVFYNDKVSGGTDTQKPTDTIKPANTTIEPAKEVSAQDSKATKKIDTNDKEVQQVKGVKTGDMSHPLLYAFGLIASLGMLFAKRRFLAG